MYRSQDTRDADGRSAGDVAPVSTEDLAWARAMLGAVCNAPDRHAASARFDELIDGARESVERTEAVVVIAQKFRNRHDLKKGEAGALVLEMMSLRLDLFESAAGLEEQIGVLLGTYHGL